MRKLLATTAMCLVFASGANGIASASVSSMNVDFESSYSVLASETLNVLMADSDLFRGDFQQLSLSSQPDGMYSGWGSRKMVSVVAERY